MSGDGSNGCGSNGRYGEWPTTLEVSNPYVSRGGPDGMDHKYEPARTDEESELPPTISAERKRRRKPLLFLVSALSVICVGLGVYVWSSGNKRVTYQIAEKKTVRPSPINGQSKPGVPGEPGVNDSANQMTSEAINQAKEELRKAGDPVRPTTTPSVAGFPAPGGDRPAMTLSSSPSFTPYRVPDTADIRDAGETSGAAGERGAASRYTGRYGGGGGNADQTSNHNSTPGAYSIYAASPERAATSPAQVHSPIVESRSAKPALALAPVKLPPFGALLPVRTLGVFYTFKNSSLARLELTRDMSGDGWALKRGTVLVAQNQGSVNNRAFLSFAGFIEPDTNRFIRLSGDVLGGDGGPGVKGKKRKIGGALGPALNRIANGALQLGQAALSRGSSTVVIPGGGLVGYGNDFGLSQNVVARREFVEVPAGAPGYVLVTALPKEVKGLDADPSAQVEDYLKAEDSLSEAEMADLLSNGTPAQIKEALPRMPPDMRKVAELALNNK